MSDPCTYGNAVYTRYHQLEVFKVVCLILVLSIVTHPNLLQKYEVITNPYDKAQRLNLYGFDGAPLNPMYLAYKPPEMLPTQTLNPTSSTTGTRSTATNKARRSIEDDPDGLLQEAMNRNALLIKQKVSINADRLWWLGAGMTALGGVGYFCF